MRIRRADASARLLSLMVAAVLTCFASACRRPARADNIAIEWTLTPSPPTVGRNTLRLIVRDTQQRPVSGARLRIEAHMSHPGMAPVLATPIEREPGHYEAELDLTMQGDWTLLVSGSLADGTTIGRQIDIRGVRASG